MTEKEALKILVQGEKTRIEEIEKSGWDSNPSIPYTPKYSEAIGTVIGLLTKESHISEEDLQEMMSKKYQTGLCKAWNMAKRTVNMSPDEIEECFGVQISMKDLINAIPNLYDPLYKLQSYDERKNRGELREFADLYKSI